MDVGAGHFARLRFATDSEFSVDFAKEIAAIAYAVVKEKPHGSPRAGHDTDNGLPRVRSESAESTDAHISEEGNVMSPDLNAVSPPHTCSFYPSAKSCPEHGV